MKQLFFYLTALLPTIAFGQSYSFVCNWNVECTIDEGCYQSQMNFTFFVTDEGKAFMQGNVGLVEVFEVVGDEATSFVHPLASGAVQTTTIKNGGVAVHSRHTVLLQEFVTSQWHGRCQRFEGQ